VKKPYRAKVAVMAAMAAGRKRVDAGDLKGAIRAFDRAVALDGLAAQAYLYRAGLKLLAGDEDGAAADFYALAGLDHSHLPAYRDLTTLSAEEFPALIPACKRLLARRPDCAWGWVFHAFSLRSLMKYDEAVGFLDRAVACAPKSAALWAMRSRVKLTNRQDFYDGVRDMETAVRLGRDWGWLHCWLGEALRHQRKFRRALAALDRGLALDPRYKRGYAWRGGVKVALGLWESAREDLDRSLAFDPIYHYDFEYTADQKSWAYNQRQLAGRGLGQTGQALRDLDQAHRHGPRYAWVYSPNGDPADYERGVAELDAHLARSPRDARAWAWRGWTLLSARRPEDALESLRRARRLSPRSAWPAAWEGQALAALGRHAEAVRSLSFALKRDPSYAPAWGWRAQARRAAGDLSGAVRDFTTAVERDHRAAWALAGRGEARQKLGLLDLSRADLDRALGILPDYPQALGWRAETRRLQGDLSGALTDADAALELLPGQPLVLVTRSLVKQALEDFAGQASDMAEAARLAPGLFAEAAG
jgi:tetratricopeptide (TPR) repeat protein